MTEHENISRALSEFRDRRNIRLLRDIVASGSGRAVIDSLVDANRPEESVNDAMAELENLAQLDEPLACLLMAYLWDIASDVFMHDVCDAIDLWILHARGTELTSRLLQFAGSQTDDRVRSHFENLVKIRRTEEA